MTGMNQERFRFCGAQEEANFGSLRESFPKYVNFSDLE